MGVTLKPQTWNYFKVTPYGCHSQTPNLKLFQGDTQGCHQGVTSRTQVSGLRKFGCHQKKETIRPHQHFLDLFWLFCQFFLVSSCTFLPIDIQTGLFRDRPFTTSPYNSASVRSPAGGRPQAVCQKRYIWICTSFNATGLLPHYEKFWKEWEIVSFYLFFFWHPNFLKPETWVCEVAPWWHPWVPPWNNFRFEVWEWHP